MSDSKDLELTEQLTKLSQAMGDVVIADVFKKYDVKPEHRRQLSPEQKAEIKNLVEDIKARVETFLQQTTTQKVAAPAPAAEAAPAEEAPQAKRFRLRVKRNETEATEPVAEAEATENNES